MLLYITSIAAVAMLPIPSAGASSSSLIIPAIGVNAAIVEAPIVDGQWKTDHLTSTVGHFELTAYPGGGNVVLGSHYTVGGRAGIFYNLGSLQASDTIQVIYGGVTYNYVVSHTFQVAPSEVSVTYPTSDSRLTLITCSGTKTEGNDYTNRLVVVAFPQK